MLKLQLALLGLAMTTARAEADSSQLTLEQIHSKCVRIATAADYGDYKRGDPKPGYFQIRFDPRNNAIVYACNHRINTPSQLRCVKQERILLRRINPESTQMNRAYTRGEKNYHKIALDPNGVIKCGGG
jgi:hypothetical protein